MQNFEGFGLSEELNNSLAKMHYSTPTPIQAQAIPLALQGNDILGSAQTGTGKTAAFSIPLVEFVINNPGKSALILTPTRELAKQVLDVVHQLLGYKSKVNTAFIIGGEPMGKQFTQLRANPSVIVGTPGRINDHLDRGSLNLSQTAFLVLDETDRMLDMGFGIQLESIVEHLPKKRQTLMFSATLPQEIVKMSSKYLNNPTRISVGESNVVAKNIKTDVIRIDQSEKYKELVNQLHDRMGSAIIFIKTKHAADRMATNLRRDGFTSEALHGDLRQTKRDKVMQNFRKMNFRILVATDIAARGLDVPHIEHVINYDLPQVAEDYIHRMGRTARAGATGSALCFISPQDGRKWHAIESLLDPTIAKYQGTDSGKSKSDGRGRRKPAFKGKFGGDKPEGRDYAAKRPFGDRKPFAKKEFDGERSEGRDYAAKRPLGDKKPFAKKEFGGERSEGRSYEGKKPFNGERSEGRDYAAKRPFGDKKPFAKKEFGGERSEGRSYEGKKPFNGERSEGRDYAAKRLFGDKKPFAKKEFGGERSEGRSYEGKKPFNGERSEGRDYAAKRPFGDKKPFAKKEFGGERSEGRSYEGKKPFNGERSEGRDYAAKRPFGDKKPFAGKKPYASKSEDRATDVKKSFGAKKPFAGKKPFGAKSDSQKSEPKKPYIAKDGSRPAKRTFKDKPKASSRSAA